MDSVVPDKKHSFFSESRNGIKIKGVSDVISFDESGVALETAEGSMAVEGEGLHVTVLNIEDGIVEVDGRINGLYYYEAKPNTKKGILGRRSD